MAAPFLSGVNKLQTKAWPLFFPRPGSIASPLICHCLLSPASRRVDKCYYTWRLDPWDCRQNRWERTHTYTYTSRPVLSFASVDASNNTPQNTAEDTVLFLFSSHVLHEGELVSRHGVAAAQLGVDLEAQVGQVLDLGRVDVLQEDALCMFFVGGVDFDFVAGVRADAHDGEAESEIEGERKGGGSACWRDFSDPSSFVFCIRPAIQASGVFRVPSCNCVMKKTKNFSKKGLCFAYRSMYIYIVPRIQPMKSLVFVVRSQKTKAQLRKDVGHAAGEAPRKWKQFSPCATSTYLAPRTATDGTRNKGSNNENTHTHTHTHTHTAFATGVSCTPCKRRVTADGCFPFYKDTDRTRNVQPQS